MQWLLIWSLRYTEDFSEEITRNAHKYVELKHQRLSPSGRRPRGHSISEVERYIEECRRLDRPLPGRLEGHKVVICWNALARILDSRSVLAGTPRRLIESSGLRVEIGLGLDVPNTSTIHGSQWLTRPIKYEEARRHALDLTAACFIVIAYLSGMRPGEVLNLERGCSSVDPVAGLHLVTGKTWKGARDSNGQKFPEGTERTDPWVVIEPVSRAIDVLEKLYGGPVLFPRELDPRLRVGNQTIRDINLELRRFIERVNSYCKENNRTDFIPYGDDVPRIQSRCFRRTLAWPRAFTVR